MSSTALAATIRFAATVARIPFVAAMAMIVSSVPVATTFSSGDRVRTSSRVAAGATC